MGANDKLAATLHPNYACESCTCTYPSYLAALDCADQDALESEDRANGRLFRSHRG
jgi:hypothetical protein